MDLEKLWCLIFGHDWRYNFKSMPSKAICKRCYCRAEFRVKTLEWEEVKQFDGETRPCLELIKKWVP